MENKLDSLYDIRGIPVVVKEDSEEAYLARVSGDIEGLEDLLLTIPDEDITKKIVIEFLKNINYFDEVFIRCIPERFRDDEDVNKLCIELYAKGYK